MTTPTVTIANTTDNPRSAIVYLSRFTRWTTRNTGLFFVMPAVLLWLFVGLYPVVTSVALSFHRWNGFGKFSVMPSYVCDMPTCRYVGLDNFINFLKPNTPAFKTFFNALGHNFWLIIVVTIGVIALALPLALALNHAGRGIMFFRSLLLLPMVTVGIAVYYVWSFIYQPGGLLNIAIQTFGLNQLYVKEGWLANIHTALPALGLIMIWSSVPFAVVLYLAGLQTIPTELLEAATVDGATSWKRLLYIIWPLLRPITIIIVITNISAGLQSYELPLLMTDGGPTNHTTVAGLLVYKAAFGGGSGQTLDMGIASAYGWMLFLLGLGLSIFSLRSMRSLD